MPKQDQGKLQVCRGKTEATRLKHMKVFFHPCRTDREYKGKYEQSREQIGFVLGLMGSAHSLNSTKEVHHIRPLSSYSSLHF